MPKHQSATKMQQNHYGLPAMLRYSRSTSNLMTTAASTTDYDLPDQYLRLSEQQQQLKLQLRRQEDENRRMKGQLQRLQQQQKNRPPSVSLAQLSRADQLVRQQSEQIVELQQMNLELRKQNQKLKDNFLLMKIKSTSSGQSITSGFDAFEHVQPRVDTGLRTNFRFPRRPKTTARSRSAVRLNGSESQRPETGATKVSFSAQVQQRRYSIESEEAGDGPEATISGPLAEQPIGMRLLREARDEIAKLEQIVLMQQNFIERTVGGRASIPLEGQRRATDRLSSLSSDSGSEILEERNLKALKEGRDEGHQLDDRKTTQNQTKFESIDRRINQGQSISSEISLRRGRFGQIEKDATYDGSDKERLRSAQAQERPETPIGSVNGTRSSLRTVSPRPEMAIELANHVDQLREELRVQRQESAQLRLRLMQSELEEGRTEGLNRHLDQLRTENEILRNSLEQFSAQWLKTSGTSTLGNLNLNQREAQLKRLIRLLEDGAKLDSIDSPDVQVQSQSNKEHALVNVEKVGSTAKEPIL